MQYKFLTGTALLSTREILNMQIDLYICKKEHVQLCQTMNMNIWIEINELQIRERAGSIVAFLCFPGFFLLAMKVLLCHKIFIVALRAGCRYRLHIML